MNDKPRIYSTCSAGCPWETIHRSELEGVGYRKPIIFDGNYLTLNATEPFSVLVKVKVAELVKFKIIPNTTYDIDGGSNTVNIQAVDFDIYKNEVKLTFYAVNETLEDDGLYMYSFICDVNGQRKIGTIKCEREGERIPLDTFTILVGPITQADYINEGSNLIVQGEAGYTPQREVDYWTEEDKEEIKAYVDEAILGGAW